MPPFREEVEIVCGWTQVNKGGIQASTPAPSAAVQSSTAPPPVAKPQIEESATSFGSGFVIAPMHVVTNYHVVNGCSGILVRRGDHELTAKRAATAVSSDLALLVTQSSMGLGAPIRTSAALGEDVMVAGHPLAGILSADLVVTTGQVNSLAGLGNDPGLFQFSAPIQPGNSGGPLLDRNGNVVGVAVAKVNSLKLEKLTGDLAQNINFAIKPEVLRLFLDTNRAGYQRSTTGKKLENVELADVARRVTVQVICTK